MAGTRWQLTNGVLTRLISSRTLINEAGKDDGKSILLYLQESDNDADVENVFD